MKYAALVVLFFVSVALAVVALVERSRLTEAEDELTASESMRKGAPTVATTTARASEARHQVKTFCAVSPRSQFSVSTGRKGRLLDVTVIAALEGTETVTAAADSQLHEEKVGDRTPMRVYVRLTCDSFLPEGVSIADGLKDERETRPCDATFLDLSALDKGEPFSITLFPRVQRGWTIRTVSNDFGSVTIGDGEGEDLQLTGVHPFGGKDTTDILDARDAHISWNYTVGHGGAMGSSRVELASDCGTRTDR